MKNLLIIAIISTLSLGARAGEGSTKAYAEAHGQLNLSVTGMNSTDGSLKVLLFNASEGFPTEEWNAVYALDVDIAASDGRVVFESIPYGSYAIYVYHDVNGNGKLDKNWSGVAKEPFGYTAQNGASRVTPLFSQSAFEFDADDHQLEIELHPAK